MRPANRPEAPAQRDSESDIALYVQLIAAIFVATRPVSPHLFGDYLDFVIWREDPEVEGEPPYLLEEPSGPLQYVLVSTYSCFMAYSRHLYAR